MKIEISTTFAATDGSMPENVTVTVETADGQALPWEVIQPVLDSVLTAPDRYELLPPRLTKTRIEPPAPRVGQQQDGVHMPVSTGERLDIPAETLNRQCGRLGCGHRQYVHLDVDDQGADMGPYAGRCYSCDNEDKCRSFVASTGVKA